MKSRPNTLTSSPSATSVGAMLLSTGRLSSYVTGSPPFWLGSVGSTGGVLAGAHASKKSALARARVQRASRAEGRRMGLHASKLHAPGSGRQAAGSTRLFSGSAGSLTPADRPAASRRARRDPMPPARGSRWQSQRLTHAIGSVVLLLVVLLRGGQLGDGRALGPLGDVEAPRPVGQDGLADGALDAAGVVVDDRRLA